MHEIRELLRHRESQLERLEKEIDALRTTLAILEAEESKAGRKSETSMDVPSNGTGTFGPALTPKQFP